MKVHSKPFCFIFIMFTCFHQNFHTCIALWSNGLVHHICNVHLLGVHNVMRLYTFTCSSRKISFNCIVFLLVNIENVSHRLEHHTEVKTILFTLDTTTYRQKIHGHVGER